jgi:uncharacterized protein YecE (DUF72 family)
LPGRWNLAILSAMIGPELKALPANVLVGTSSWSSPDWVGNFYPTGTQPSDFITEYARHLPTVEIDASFYRPPSARTVDGWVRKTPPGFLFAAKVPQTITHEKGLVGCERETASFLETMARLGDRLGPLVFQFAYVAKGKDAEEYRTGADFRRRLAAYLPMLPKDFRYAVEVRNATWLDEDLLSLLRAHDVALVLTDYYTMPGLPELKGKIDPLTADFAFVRFLGHRKRMEELIAQRRQEAGKQRDFDELLVDRTRQMERWVPALQRLAPRVSRMLVYFNNHYAGYAPGSVSLFARTWGRMRQSHG